MRTFRILEKALICAVVLFVLETMTSCNIYQTKCKELPIEDKAFITLVNEVDLPDSLMVSDVNVYFTYDTIIDGYKLFGRFIPYLDERYKNGIAETGTLILLAKNVNGGKGFSYFTEVHSSQNTYKLMDSYTANQLLKENNKVFHLKYNNEQSEYWQESTLLYDTPFQFIDVDFDGEDEFLYNDYYQGKGGNNYYAYDIQDSTLKKCELPCVLDNFVRFDKSSKTLILEAHDGVFEYCKAVFKKETESSPVVELRAGSLLADALALYIYEDYKSLKQSTWKLESLYQKYTNCNVERDEYLFENRGNVLCLINK